MAVRESERENVLRKRREEKQFLAVNPFVRATT